MVSTLSRNSGNCNLIVDCYDSMVIYMHYLYIYSFHISYLIGVQKSRINLFIKSLYVIKSFKSGTCILISCVSIPIKEEYVIVLMYHCKNEIFQITNLLHG